VQSRTRLVYKAFSLEEVPWAMQGRVLGRTNRAFPHVWLSLSVPRVPDPGELHDLVAAAADSGLPLDVSSHPALWAGGIRGHAGTLLTIGGSELPRATDEQHAYNLTQAHLIETLCAVGREDVDFYCLSVNAPLQEFQISGALNALEDARQEGHVRHLGISCDGPAWAVLNAWSMHDAFELALIPKNPIEESTFERLAPLARERRVGIVTTRPLAWIGGVPVTAFSGDQHLPEAILSMRASENTVLVGVRSRAEVEAAVRASKAPREEDLSGTLQELAELYRTKESWEELLEHKFTTFREAAKRRLRDFQRA
jgi:hypothetical protein